MKLPTLSLPVKKYRIFLIDDHPLIREGMSKVIEREADLNVCGEFGSAKGAIDAISRNSPDVILLDLSLSDGSGIELIKDFRAADIACPIIVVSMHDENLYAERALRAGANGYLMKEKASAQVILSIRTVLDGDIFLSEPMKRQILSNAVGKAKKQNSEANLNILSDRELQIFELFGQGMSVSEIASHLRLSPKTVDSHRSNMKDKLGIGSSSQLLCSAVRWVESGAFDL